VGKYEDLSQRGLASPAWRVHVDTETPPFSIPEPAVGDLVLTPAGVRWTYGADGQWTTLVGPTGPTGPIGPTGATGPVGPAGPSGNWTPDKGTIVLWREDQKPPKGWKAYEDKVEPSPKGLKYIEYIG